MAGELRAEAAFLAGIRGQSDRCLFRSRRRKRAPVRFSTILFALRRYQRSWPSNICVVCVKPGLTWLLAYCVKRMIEEGSVSWSSVGKGSSAPRFEPPTLRKKPGRAYRCDAPDKDGQGRCGLYKLRELKVSTCSHEHSHRRPRTPPFKPCHSDQVISRFCLLSRARRPPTQPLKPGALT